jgi:hypothetical protein
MRRRRLVWIMSCIKYIPQSDIHTEHHADKTHQSIELYYVNTMLDTQMLHSVPSAVVEDEGRPREGDVHILL